jgi:xylulokinase
MTAEKGPVLIGIDIGTTGVKVIALEPDTGRVVASATSEYPSRSTPHGGHEQDPQSWWDAVAGCCRQVMTALGDRTVEAVATAGHMHSLLLLDEANEPVFPAMTWADRRAVEESNWLSQLGVFPSRAGNQVVGAFTAPKLAWLGRKLPGALRRARRLVMSKDYVGYLLTGAWATDETDAIGTLLYDLHAREWSPELFDAVGASVDLGLPVLRSTDLRGRITADAATATMLPVGTPVAIGAGDVSAVAVGSGVVDPSSLCINVGTAAQAMGLTDAPAAGSGFTFGSALGEGYLTMASVYAAGASVNWAVRAVLGGEDIDKLALGSVPGAHGLSYLPFMFGMAVPRKNDSVRAMFLGQTESHDTSDIAAAVLEGVAYACADALDCVAATVGNVQVVRLVGGVSRSAPWRTALAAVSDAALVHMPTGGSSVGAAILGGLAVGKYENGGEAATLMEEAPVVPPAGEDAEAYRLARVRFQQWCELVA